jgi:hypothetical protein
MSTAKKPPTVLIPIRGVQRELEFLYAKRYAVDPASPQAKRLAELEGRVREIRGR